MIDPAIFAAVVALRTATPVNADFRQLECLADAVYHESRGEPLAAQVAVAGVVVRRGNPCEVVRKPRQFAYRRLADRRRTEVAAWVQAAEVAVLVGTGTVVAHDATHFHDTRQTPAWTARMTLVGKAGNMVFWKGR